MSKLDQKLKASIKPKHGKAAAPAKPAAAAKPAPAPKAETKPTPAPAKAGTGKTAGNTSALFPERVWPD